MKKIKIIHSLIALLAITLMISFNATAQKKNVSKALTWAEQGVKLDTALGSVNAALKDEKTKEWAKTYYTKGMVYQAIFTTENEEFKSLCTDPLIEAFDNFKKAYNMEGAGVLKGMIDANLLTLSNQVLTEAENAYKANDFERAYKYFAKSIEVRQMPVFGEVVDTSLMFNTAYCAQRAEMYKEAIDFYSQAQQYAYGEGDTYRLISDCQMASGDTVSAVSTLKNGFEKYPGDQNMVIALLNYYLIVADNATEALNYISAAKENDPENAELYAAEGHLHDKMGDIDKALEQYNKAIELDPNSFNAYYNVGVIIYNQAVELMDEANKILDNQKFIEAKAVADAKFKEALPYLEKAHEINPDEVSLIDTLKSLYYRLGMTEKFEEMKALLEQ